MSNTTYPSDWFEQITSYLAEGISKRKISDIFNVKYPAATRRYDREYIRRLEGKQKPIIINAYEKTLKKRKDVDTTPYDRASIWRRYGGLDPIDFKSKASPNYWNAKFGGPGFHWNLTYLTTLSLFIKNSRKGFGFLPRSYGKTTRIMGDFTRYILETREPHLIISYGRGGKNRIFRRIKKLLHSKPVRLQYGDVIESSSLIDGEIWFKDELYSNNDPTLKVTTRGGEVIGMHPRRIHLEDIIQTEFKSDESNQGLFDWYNDVIKYCAVESTQITGTGTRKAKNDWYSRIIELNYELLRLKALTLIKGRYPEMSDATVEHITDEDGKVRRHIKNIDMSVGEYEVLECPNWTKYGLMEARLEDPESFESQMQNNPLPSQGLYFSKRHWQVVPSFPIGHLDAYFTSTDPGYGQSKGADNTASLVCGVFENVLYIVDGFMDKMGIDEITDGLDKNNTKYRPISNFLEENFAQVWLKQRGHAQGTPIEGVENKRNKIMRIDALKWYFKNGYIRIYNNCPIRNQLFEEYVQYNRKDSTSERHDDGLDALSMLVQKISHYLVQRTYKDMKALSGRALTNSYNNMRER